jgi:RNA polymerase sigma factor (sigma-70 family)
LSDGRRGDPLERADPLLNPLLEARKQEQAAEIERLLARAAPAAAQIIERYSLAAADGEEIAAVVSYRLFRRLDAIVSSAQPVIEGFDDYVTRLTVNTIHDHLRTSFPERTRMKNQLRHLLTHAGVFALWPTSVGTAAGLARWRGRTDVLDEGDLDALGLASPELDVRDPRRTLHQLFERLDRPVRFDAIVTLFDDAREPAPAAGPVEVEFDGSYDRQDLLRALWQEVLQLPPQQRMALLLNLRDPEGTDAIALLIVTGVATAAELAAALELTEVQLAELWLELPLSDNAIADRLGIDRQKVINLRKSARKRLARRLQWGPEKKRT